MGRTPCARSRTTLPSVLVQKALLGTRCRKKAALGFPRFVLSQVTANRVKPAPRGSVRLLAQWITSVPKGRGAEMGFVSRYASQEVTAFLDKCVPMVLACLAAN